MRRPLPALESSTIMAQIAIGQYSLETLLDSVVSAKLLKFDVDPSIVSFVCYCILLLVLDIENEPFFCMRVHHWLCSIAGVILESILEQYSNT